jgi:hypothetical protein
MAARRVVIGEVPNRRNHSAGAINISGMATAAIPTQAEAVVRARKICVVMLLLPIFRPTCPGRTPIRNPQIVGHRGA